MVLLALATSGSHVLQRYVLHEAICHSGQNVGRSNRHCGGLRVPLESPVRHCLQRFYTVRWDFGNLDAVSQGKLEGQHGSGRPEPSRLERASIEFGGPPYLHELIRSDLEVSGLLAQNEKLGHNTSMRFREV